MFAADELGRDTKGGAIAGDAKGVGSSPALGGGGNGGMGLLRPNGGPGVPGDASGCAPGNGAVIPVGPGVPRLGVGCLALIKSSGISFQSLTFLAADGGGTDGEAVPVRGGGGRDTGCGGAKELNEGGAYVEAAGC